MQPVLSMEENASVVPLPMLRLPMSPIRNAPSLAMEILPIHAEMLGC
jgi:hypothetical protein